jgi:hypothetical protein
MQIIKYGRESERAIVCGECIIYFQSPRVFPQRSAIDNFCYEGVAGKTAASRLWRWKGGWTQRVCAARRELFAFSVRESANPLVGEIRANCVEKPKVARARPSLRLELVRSLPCIMLCCASERSWCVPNWLLRCDQRLAFGFSRGHYDKIPIRRNCARD